MKLVIGLDISTSVIGVTLLENVTCKFDATQHIVEQDTIVFKPNMDFWDKCDLVYKYFCTLKEKLDASNKTVVSFGVEAPLKRFVGAKSSASTICLLQRFNGIVSYVVRMLFHTDPVYINVNHARKACGIKIMQKKYSGGLNAKQQTAKWLFDHDLYSISYPIKRGHDLTETKTIDNVKPFVFDMVDSYVVARGTMLL